MKIVIFFYACVISFFHCTVLPAQAAEWRLPVGISYLSGLSDVNDLHDHNLEAEGYTVNSHKFVWPLGITLQPYLLFDNGLGLGLGFGPCMFSLGGEYSFSNIPIGLHLRYIIFQSEETSPYARIGFHYNIASGDYVESSSPGLFGAIGYEFRRNRNLGLGVEIAYDTSKIKFDQYYLNSSHDMGTKEIRPYGIILDIFITF